VLLARKSSIVMIIFLSAILVCAGVIGLMMRPGIVKAFIALESIVFAVIINFVNVMNDRYIPDPYIAILFAIASSCLTFCLVFVTINLQLNDEKSTDILDDCS
jgi:NADH:ubiquinone oxidoreductase subunit K